jgi:4-hydroxy-tetrahydrodipicolinate synthase
MLDITRLEGLGVALVTPFFPAAAGGDPLLGSGAVDLAAFERLTSRAAKGGADFLVVLGSTGEGPTVLPEERDLLIARAKKAAYGKPIVVGTGHNSTREACALARRAAESGADALLVVTPYYNKPQAGGMLRHYAAIADAAPDLPIIAYNVPGRTGLNLLPRDLDLLWSLPQVVAVKESSGNLAQIGEIARRLPAGKLLLSGDDGLALASIAAGARGLISVIGNLLPAETKALVDAAIEGRAEEARDWNRRLLPLMDALFLESNPVPIKAALSLVGLCEGAVRLPLVPASPATQEGLGRLLQEFASLALRATGEAVA